MKRRETSSRGRKGLGLTTRLLLAGALLAAIVLGVFATLLVALGDLRGSSRLAQRSEQTASAANDLERLTIQLETGQRGYALSGKPRFLEPWHRAQTAIPEQEAALRSLVAGPTQRQQEAAVERAIENYLKNWSLPLVRTAMHDRAAAARMVASGKGDRMIATIRTRFAALLAENDRISAERRSDAEAAGRRAVLLGVVGIAASALVIAACVAYIACAVVAPVRRLAATAWRVGLGDLSARVPERGAAEVGELSTSFNEMAASLQTSRDELENQQAELERQATALEAQNAQLAAQHAQLENVTEQLVAQGNELERTLAELSEEEERLALFVHFGERLAAEITLGSLAETIVVELARTAGADRGALYVVDEEGLDGPELAATLGADRSAFPARVEPGVEAAGEALAKRRVRRNDGGHALHVPLVHGDMAVGLAMLVRTEGEQFGEATSDTLEHLAAQAAVALANALSFRAARRQATITLNVLDATTDGIRLIDLAGRTLLANAAMERIATELFAAGDGSSYLPDLVARHLENPEAFLANQARLADQPEAVTHEEMVHAATGRSFHRYTAPVRDAAGALLGRIVVVREVTAEREGERLKSELVATVSHELRTPLASILGFAELLATRELSRESTRRYLDTIHREAERLSVLVDDFLDLQRIEHGRFTLALHTFPLEELLAEQTELYAAQSTEHTLDLDVPDGGSLLVCGDHDRVAQLVGNLLSNAVKYSPGGGPIKVAAERLDGVARVSIADRGLGIPVDQQHKLFTKFFRVDSSDTRAIGGTGLGLALSREIIEAHGGTIGFETVEGEGSTFWFELPLAEEEREAERQPDGAAGSRLS